MKDSPIIILDEATANVDPENERDLMNALVKQKGIYARFIDSRKEAVSWKL